MSRPETGADRRIIVTSRSHMTKSVEAVLPIFSDRGLFFNIHIGVLSVNFRQLLLLAAMLIMLCDLEVQETKSDCVLQ